MKKQDEHLEKKKIHWQSAALGMIGIYAVAKLTLRVILLVKTLQIQKKFMENMEPSTDIADHDFDIYHKYD